MIKRIFQYVRQDLAVADIIIDAKVDHALEIYEIGGVGSGASQGLDIMIGGEKMLFLPCVDSVNSVCPPPNIATANNGFFGMIRDKFPEVPRLIVGQGERLTITRRLSGAACVAHLWFIDHYGENLPVNTQPGGSMNDDRPFCITSQQSVITGAASTVITVINNLFMPSGYPSFPFSGIVLPGVQYDLLGLACYVDVSAAPNTTMNGIRLWKMNESLLTPNEGFVPFTVFPPQVSTGDKHLTLFEQPISFNVNETCIMEVSTTNVGVAAETVIVCLTPVFHIKPTTGA